MRRKMKTMSLVLIPFIYIFYIYYFYIYSYYRQIADTIPDVRIYYRYGLEGSVEYVDVYMYIVIFLSTLISILLFIIYRYKRSLDNVIYNFITQIVVHSSLIVTAFYDYQRYTKYFEYNRRPFVACNFKFYFFNILYAIIIYIVLVSVDGFLSKIKKKKRSNQLQAYKSV